MSVLFYVTPRGIASGVPENMPPAYFRRLATSLSLLARSHPSILALRLDKIKYPEQVGVFYFM